MKNSHNNIIRLDKNESYYFLNEEILSELKSFDYDVVTTYPDIEELRNLIAQYVNHPSQKVLPCHGSEQSIRLSILNLLKSNDKVILLAPAFVAFDYALDYAGIKPTIIHYTEHGDQYVAPVEKLINSLDQNTKCLMLCNPSNPLGCAISEADLFRIIKHAKKFNTLVIVDEVYAKFSGISCQELLKDFDNLIILGSFSKEYGLAGVRLGYLLAAPGIIQRLENDRRMFWPVSHFALHTLKVLLKYRDYFDNQIKNTVKRRDKLIAFLRQLGLKCYDSETNFFIVKSDKKQEIIDYLATNNIRVGEVNYFWHGELLLKDAFRISIPSPEDAEKLVDHFNLLQR